MDLESRTVRGISIRYDWSLTRFLEDKIYYENNQNDIEKVKHLMKGFLRK